LKRFPSANNPNIYKKATVLLEKDSCGKSIKRYGTIRFDKDFSQQKLKKGTGTILQGFPRHISKKDMVRFDKDSCSKYRRKVWSDLTGIPAAKIKDRYGND
jgi:hypothetical protein